MIVCVCIGHAMVDNTNKFGLIHWTVFPGDAK